MISLYPIFLWVFGLNVAREQVWTELGLSSDAKALYDRVRRLARLVPARSIRQRIGSVEATTGVIVCAA